MAQMAARRTQRPVPEPVETNEDFRTEEQPAPEYAPARANEFDYGSDDLEPVEPAGDDRTGFDADESFVPEPPEPADDTTSETQGRHRSTRRMATPPWQTPASSMNRAV